MAKVSTYPAVTAVNAADTIYLVQGGVSKRGNLTVPWAFGGDVSVAGALTLTGTVVGPIKIGDGSAAVPSYSFSGEATTGIYRSSVGRIGFSAQGSVAAFIDNSNGNRIISDNFVLNIASPDVILTRDAANTLAQRNGTNAQAFRLYNTFTDAGNYERFTSEWLANIHYLRTANAGTGAARELAVGTSSAANLYFQTNALSRFQIGGGDGHLIASVDNTYDIGASGAARPRTGYFGTSVRAPLGVFGTATDGPIHFTIDGLNVDLNVTTDSGGNGHVLLKTSGGNDISLGSNGGTQFNVAHTASAVNFVQVTGNITTGDVIISAQGSDANVGIRVDSKGTGNVVLNPSSGDIKWNKALVALGGGSTPTFGTIGGSGPATAAQNTWMRVLDSTGAAFWVPAWK